jgi:hypothetical protein
MNLYKQQQLVQLATKQQTVWFRCLLSIELGAVAP